MELRSTNEDQGAWVHRQAELQAQIAKQEQRWREAEAEWVERFDALTRERDELRASVEALLVLNQDQRAEIERLQRENGALARTYALADKLLRERTEALNEALAQNERFDKRYRDAEAEVERLRAAVVEIGAAHVAAQTEVERQRVEIKSWGRIWNDARIIELRAEALRDGTALLD